MLIAFRKLHPGLRRPLFVDPFAVDGAAVAGAVGGDITWHGVSLQEPDWSYHSRTLALEIRGPAPAAAPESDDVPLYLAFNSWTDELSFELPPLPGQHWHRVVDTALASPDDIVAEIDAVPVPSTDYVVAAHSTIVLLGR